MRLIWTSDNADQFRSFCSFLKAKGIDFSIEEQVNRNWDSEQYGQRKYLLWIKEEDQVEESIQSLVRFLDNPQNPDFSSSTNPSLNSHASSVTQFLEERLHQPIEKKADIEIKKEFSGHMRLTALIILICSCLFLYDLYNEKTSEKKASQERLGISPVKRALLFDYPQSDELLDKVVALYGPDALSKPQDLPAPGKFLYEKALKEPAFPGYYPYIVAEAKELRGEKTNLPPVKEMHLFQKIREGELWRLFTPTLLHSDILHLFFNMIWLLLLGTQIEARLGSMRYILLMLIAGILSNTLQYLMTGPNFIGFSGIVCAMATYIKARQQVAPWEAYQMSSGTFLFICFFVGLLAVLSLVTFFLEVFQNASFPISIANTAHLVGALVGYSLGRMRFFAWQLRN
jgi:GlpG protein